MFNLKIKFKNKKSDEILDIDNINALNDTRINTNKVKSSNSKMTTSIKLNKDVRNFSQFQDVLNITYVTQNTCLFGKDDYVNILEIIF